MLRCGGCQRTPEEIGYAGYRDEGETDSEYVLREEGTLDPKSLLFLCDECYIKYGMPSSPYGWKATPQNLVDLFIGV